MDKKKKKKKIKHCHQDGQRKSVHPEVKLDVHVFSEATGVVIPQCFGVPKGLEREGVRQKAK